MYNCVAQTVNTPIVSTTTTNYWGGINQVIEGFNCYDLLGKPVIVSFIFQTNVTGMYSIAVTDGNASNSWVTTFLATANIPEKVIIPVSMLPTPLFTPNTSSAGLSVVVGMLNTGMYQTSTLGMWQTGNWQSATGATNWGLIAGNYIAMTQLQLEAGTSATTFENRPTGTEFSLCQRYYQTSLFATGTQYATTAAQVSVNWVVEMRGIPTVTLANYNIAGVGTPTNPTITAPGAYPSNFVADITFTAIGGVGYTLYADATAGAEL
jgi:hypothetical protein